MNVQDPGADGEQLQLGRKQKVSVYTHWQAVEILPEDSKNDNFEGAPPLVRPKKLLVARSERSMFLAACGQTSISALF